MQEPSLLKGASHTDSRGTIRFANNFLMDEIKRFYLIHHKDTSTVRAWQAHRLEQKWFYVTEGTFKIVLIKPDNWEKPKKIVILEEFELCAENNEVLHIPVGFANGFKALRPNSKMMVYTDSYIEDATKDDLRFPLDYWYDWEQLTSKPKNLDTI